MSRDTIKDLTLMLMYLTSWEESLVPGLRKKPDRAGIYPKARICWKGYDFGILNELTDEGLVNAGAAVSPHLSRTRARQRRWSCSSSMESRLINSFSLGKNPHGRLIYEPL